MVKEIAVKKVEVENILLPCKQPGFDFVINPYTGCPYACKYCYASFMRRFSKHKEPWGGFVDVKIFNKELKAKKLTGKRILISSVTEPYNYLEEKYKVTRKILQQLIEIDCEVVIQTKSPLVLRDLDLLKKMKNLSVVVSLCSLEQKLADDLESGLSIEDRLYTLQELHKNNIKTVVAISPLMPCLTDWKEIIQKTKAYADEYIFEGLTLRNEFKPAMINYVWQNYHKFYSQYLVLYKGMPDSYWFELQYEINQYCEKEGVKCKEISIPEMPKLEKLNFWKD